MFKHRGNQRGYFKGKKGATFKGKNMLPLVSIFFPLIVALMRIDTNFKGPAKIELCQYVIFLKSPNFDA